MLIMMNQHWKKIVLLSVCFTFGVLYWHLKYFSNYNVNIYPLYNVYENATMAIFSYNQTIETTTNANMFVTQEYLIDLSRIHTFQGVNCLRLFTKDSNYTRAVIKRVLTFNDSLGNEDYINLTKNCEIFIKTRGYVMSPLSKEEELFPIAFSILAYKNSEMVERLLRAIYRPQNYYCIHVDLKSSEKFFTALLSLAKCFSNVFLSAKRINVNWGWFSVLEAELICMEELWRYKKWKYFINLTGQEFPLKTNFEMVKILKSFNGANNVDGTIKRANLERWSNRPPPFGLRPVKGSVHIIASRHFIDFILHNETAQTVLKWVKTVDIPDEAFFSTLNFNPKLGVRGTYNGDPDNMTDFVTRYKIWSGSKIPCAGHRTRAICIQSTGDLYRLGQAKHLFANKFFLEEDRVVIGCLEEKLFNDTRDEFLGTKTFNISYYENLTFVKNQIP